MRAQAAAPPAPPPAKRPAEPEPAPRAKGARPDSVRRRRWSQPRARARAPKRALPPCRAADALAPAAAAEYEVVVEDGFRYKRRRRTAAPEARAARLRPLRNAMRTHAHTR
jgi:hypothetical protein